MKTKIKTFYHEEEVNKFLEKPEVVYHDLNMILEAFGLIYVLTYKEVVVV